MRNQTILKIIEEIIKEVELCDNWGDNLKKAIQEGMISWLKLVHKRISSLPSLDIDSLQRYDYYFDWEWTYMDENDNWEYVRYESLVDLLRN